MRRKFTLPLTAAVVAVLAAGCGGGGSSTTAAVKPGTAPSIDIRDFKFSPGTIRVRSGARITVTNADGAPHTVTADDGQSFDSGTIDPSGSASIRAPRAGTYPYHCTIHRYMTGRLVAE